MPNPNTPWQQVTNRVAAAFAGANAELESLAAYAGVEVTPLQENEATEYEQIAARVERLARGLATINEALAEQNAPEDTGDESPEANDLSRVDSAGQPGPTTRRKSGRPAAVPSTTMQPEPGEE